MLIYLMMAQARLKLHLLEYCCFIPSRLESPYHIYCSTGVLLFYSFATGVSLFYLVCLLDLLLALIVLGGWRVLA